MFPTGLHILNESVALPTEMKLGTHQELICHSVQKEFILFGQTEISSSPFEFSGL